MTKTELGERLAPHFGDKTPTDEQLALALGLTRQAVSAWGDKVPELRFYQLRDKFPTLWTAV